MKGADQVFAAGMVDPGLATDGRIHHGQKGCGHLHHLDAAQPGGCCKTRHVPDYAAAEGHHQGAAFELGVVGRIVDLSHRGGRLLVFAGVNHQQANAETCLLEAAQTGIAIGAGDIRIADHQDTPTSLHTGVQHLLTKPGQAAGSNHHLVGIALQRNADVMQRGDCGHETVGTHLLSQQCRWSCAREISAQLPFGLGVSAAGGGVDQFVGAGAGLDGPGDELHRHRA